jgi:sarcosine oxidase gamma subunit
MVTDISHGICELSLVGDQALDFLGNHTSANLKDPRVTETRNLRCLLGQYPVILWWDQVADIRLLVDRSYAQSLCDYLKHLMQRWSQVSI